MEVAEVIVPWVAVKACKVEEPEAKKLFAYKFVEVAEVIVPLKAVKACRVVEPRERKSVVVAPPRMVRPVPVVPPPRVEEAVARKPPWKLMMVAVACSLVESLVKGQEKVMEEQPVQEVTVKLPMFATFARRLVVEASPEL